MSIYWQGMILDDIIKYGNFSNVVVATQSPYIVKEDHMKYIVEVKVNE